jgi:hypothetical protein
MKRTVHLVIVWALILGVMGVVSGDYRAAKALRNMWATGEYVSLLAKAPGYTQEVACIPIAEGQPFEPAVM